MAEDPSEDRDGVVRHIACDDVGLDEQFGVWTLGFARTECSGGVAEYLMLQSPGIGDDDWGPYFEVDDQGYGGYNLVRHITLGDDRIEFGLTKKVGHDGAMRIVVTFELDGVRSATVSRGLKLIFGNQLDALIADKN